MDLTREFPQRADVAYLNHAAVSPWPWRAAEAVRRFADENLVQGSLEYPRWLLVETGLRERLAHLLGGHMDDVALVKNTSEGLSLVASGVDWRAGDNIVTAAEEFPSNRIAWESLKPLGVEVRYADLRCERPEQALLDLIDARTRLLVVSAVQYGSGLRLDLDQLGVACRARSVLFGIDAIQALGVVPMDVSAYRADFLAADGHKWMMGPEGLGVFWCTPALRERLRLHQYGWHMVEHMGDCDRTDWEPARTARRFECGSPNMLGIHALAAGLSVLMEFGIENVEREVAARVNVLADAATAKGWTLVTPTSPTRRAGILTLRHPSVPAPAAFQKFRDAGVVCALRAGGVRLSPHFYTSAAAMELAMKVLREVR